MALLMNRLCATVKCGERKESNIITALFLIDSPIYQTYSYLQRTAEQKIKPGSFDVLNYLINQSKLYVINFLSFNKSVSRPVAALIKSLQRLASRPSLLLSYFIYIHATDFRGFIILIAPLCQNEPGPLLRFYKWTETVPIHSLELIQGTYVARVRTVHDPFSNKDIHTGYHPADGMEWINDSPNNAPNKNELDD